MIGALAKFGGRFLASKAVTVILIAVLTGAGGYITHVIKDRGSLQAQLQQERRNAQEWDQHLKGLRKLEARFDQFDRELVEARQERAEIARTVDRQIEGLRRDLPAVEDFLSRRAPDELVRVLCDDGTIDPSSPECASDDTGSLPD